MSVRLADYLDAVGPQELDRLRQLARPLAGLKVVHVNSTRTGGGVAEILHRLVPLMLELGIDASWEVVGGDGAFYECTKQFHNALQGNRVDIAPRSIAAYERTNAENAERLRPILEPADFVFIHDPQPARLLAHHPERRGKWIWRCHIDVSRPHRPVWKYLRGLVSSYDASIFSLAAFAQPLPHPQYLIPPSIDPLAVKNVDLDDDEIATVAARFELDLARPIVLQVSRFDRFKDPLGVLEAFRMVQASIPGVQLVLAGGSADDDPEGAAVHEEVVRATGDDPDVHLLLLPPDAHRDINALQRLAAVVLQKSTKEGFGLTVTEAMWKAKAVIGGNTGGIRLQVIDHHTGFLVSTPEGAALRIRYLLNHPVEAATMGATAKEFVRENFLITRQLREYLSLMVALVRGHGERIELE